MQKTETDGRGKVGDDADSVGKETLGRDFGLIELEVERDQSIRREESDDLGLIERREVH